MLGSALVKFLSSKNHEVVEISRLGLVSIKNNKAITLDAQKVSNYDSQRISQHNFDFIINAIGLIKQLIREGDPESESAARDINIQFPKWLNQFSLDYNVPIIQIGTDCVFSGYRGGYSEADEFDPSDLYGETKAVGESFSQDFMTLRTSIVGREPSTNNSLMNWVLGQPAKNEIHGYTNHFWNGVTTLAFSKVAEGIIRNGAFTKGTYHLIPSDFLNKAELVMLIAKCFHRDDLKITDFETERGINRTLATIHLEQNLKFWEMAGYNGIPTIAELISEYADWESS